MANRAKNNAIKSLKLISFCWSSHVHKSLTSQAMLEYFCFHRKTTKESSLNLSTAIKTLLWGQGDATDELATASVSRRVAFLVFFTFLLAGDTRRLHGSPLRFDCLVLYTRKHFEICSSALKYTTPGHQRPPTSHWETPATVKSSTDHQGVYTWTGILCNLLFYHSLTGNLMTRHDDQNSSVGIWQRPPPRFMN